MEALALPLPAPLPPPDCEIRRFSTEGVVVIRDRLASVYMGGTLIGGFGLDDDDRGARNILAVTLAKSRQFKLGRLAPAFGMTDEHLRRLRRKEEAGGLPALFGPRQGKATKITPELRAGWYARFEAGATAKAVVREQPRKKRLAYSTVWHVWDEWRRDHRAEPEQVHEEPAPTLVEGQLALSLATRAADDDGDDAAVGSVTPDEEEREDITPMTAQPVRGGKMVQHVGSWILLALAGEMGLYEEAQRAFQGRHPDGLRIALDAVMCSLAIGQQVVEGVRRLATPTGATLLRADQVPSASGVRKLFGRLISQTDGGGAALEAGMAERLIATAAADDGPAIFYVDNHLRPYTGKHVIRKGWRMQDRRVLPGTTDYHVHDEDGRPMLRVPVTSHDHLTDWLLPLGQRLRDALAPDEKVLVCFDRGGSFPEELAALRDANFEFVTYERKPFASLATSAFDRAIEIRGETYALHEDRRANLGKKRGRVRRIALRTPDGNQINLLAVSTLPAERLVGILLGRAGKDDPSGRWQQENAFKHGVERWGMNQLDGRQVEPYPPDAIIPNPSRRKLDRALRIWRSAEGDARRQLARLRPDDPKRERVEQDLAQSLEWQRQLEAIRPHFPTHAPVENTELAGKLMRHTGKLKTLIDVLRVVCANAESDLATQLALHMTRPREVKKVIANLFAAPGNVAVTEHDVRVRLAPAANRSEQVAISHLLQHLNQRRLVLPSDPARLPLRFEAHLR